MRFRLRSSRSDNAGAAAASSGCVGAILCPCCGGGGRRIGLREVERSRTWKVMIHSLSPQRLPVGYTPTTPHHTRTSWHASQARHRHDQSIDRSIDHVEINKLAASLPHPSDAWCVFSCFFFRRASLVGPGPMTISLEALVLLLLSPPCLTHACAHLLAHSPTDCTTGPTVASPSTGIKLGGARIARRRGEPPPVLGQDRQQSTPRPRRRPHLGTSVGPGARRARQRVSASLNC